MIRNNKRLWILVFVSAHTVHIWAQSKIINDTSQTIYGTNTTRFFTSENLFWEKRIFFRRDTFFLPDPPKFKPMDTWDIELEKQINALGGEPDTVTYAAYIPKKISESDLTDSINNLSEENKALHLIKVKKANQKRLKDSLSNERKEKRRIFLRPYKNMYLGLKADTSIETIHNYQYIWENTQMYQTLGMLGTALKAVYPTLNIQERGYRPGFHIYDAYATNPREVLYVNSRSPHTKITYINSTAKEDQVRAEWNRNISRDWSVGFEYQRITSTRNLAQVQAFRNFLVSGQDFVLKTMYKSKNQRYHAMANYTYFVHKVNEQGGLRPFRTASNGQREDLPTSTLPDNYNRIWPTVLSGNRFSIFPWDIRGGQIFSRDRRMAYYLYHQYDILSGGKMSIFHEFCRQTQKIDFLDPLSSVARENGTNPSLIDFYPKNRRKNDTIPIFNPAGFTAVTPDTIIKRNKDTIAYRSEFVQVEHKIGLKKLFLDSKMLFIAYLKSLVSGETGSLDPISASEWLKTPGASLLQFNGRYTGTSARLQQLYAGVAAHYQFADSIRLKIYIEQLALQQSSGKNDTLFRLLKNNFDYNSSAILNMRDFQIGFTAMRSSATWQQVYINHSLYYWANYFSPIIKNELFASKTFFISKQQIRLRPSYLQIQNHVFYGLNKTPEQYNGTLRYAQMEFASYWGINWARIDLTGRYAYQLSGANIIRFPNLYVHARPYVELKPVRKKGLQLFHIGIDIHYRSGYFGDAYMPALLQFHLQNDFELVPYALVDAFASAKIRNTRVFFRVNQVNQLLGSPGYYISPYYAGIRSLAVLGVVWHFFDE